MMCLKYCLGPVIFLICHKHLGAQGLRFSSNELKNQSNYGLTTADPERFGQTKVKDRFTWADTDRLPEEIGDQKDTNACVSFCMATLFHFEHPHPAGSKDQFSPYFNYFWAKKIENKWRVPTGSRWDDNGTFFWYGFRALESQGICLKHEYNYRDYGTKVYLPSVPPPAQIAADANERRLYFPPIRLQVRNLKDSIRQEISDGKILVAGFRIHENFSKNEGFEKLENGELIWKRRGSGVRYPHAMLIVGFDDNLNAFHVRNSYGPKFGNNGYIWVDYDFLIDQGGDPISTQDNPCCSIVYSYGHVEQTDFLVV